tara:strand:+ start:4096 stop:4971 length:876 start_codon:yes stop_codon:yes gene_type:complete
MTAKALAANITVENNLAGMVVDIEVNNTKQQIGSAWLVDEDNDLGLDNADSDYTTSQVMEICNNVMGTLWSVMNFSSYVTNSDQLTRKVYSDDEVDDCLTISQIAGSHGMLSFPHNIVAHHVDSRWLMKCLNIYYRVSQNYIPNYCHNLPTIITFPRSSGINCDAKIFKNGQIRIRQSKSQNDTEPNMYIRGSFFSDGSDIGEDAPSPDSSEWLYSDKKLEIVSEINNISEMAIKFNDIFTEGELTSASDDNDFVKRDVMLYFNNLHTEWVNDTLKPAISRLSYLNITLVE